jgi:anti-sigma factor RsiW
MNGNHLQPQIVGAIVDRELSRDEDSAAQAHLSECNECARRVLAAYRIKAVTRQAAQTYTPSSETLARFSAAVRQQPAKRAKVFPMRTAVWQAAAALLIAAITLIGWRYMRASDEMTAEILDQHLATLAEPSQPQVISSDKHTVKPWFEGKLPFSFNLPEPNALPQDTALLGADLTFIQGRPAALLLFRIHKHRTSVIVSQQNLFSTLVHLKKRSGFDFVSRKAGNVEFFAVSDVDLAELKALVESVAAAQ